MIDIRQVLKARPAADAPSPWWLRAWFGVTLVAAVFLGYLGLLAPARMGRSFTWAVLPPLHARFVGALYLAGAVYLALCLLARRRSQVAGAAWTIVIFTGLISVLNALNPNAFDGNLFAVKLWLAAYVFFPVLGIPIAFLASVPSPAMSGARPVPRWVSTFLLTTGTLFGVIGLALLLARGVMVDAWPWKVTAGTAQFYSAPFLALAFACLTAARRHTWPELTPTLAALCTLAVTTLVASLTHRKLFDWSDPAALIWFAILIALTVATVVTALNWRTQSEVGGLIPPTEPRIA